MAIEFHLIWKEQIGAVPAIQRRNGDDAALDYIVGEKLLNYAEASESHPEFARELPRFVAAIRCAFDIDVLRSGLQRLAGELEKSEAEAERERQDAIRPTAGDAGERDDEPDLDAEDAEWAATREVQLLAAKRKRFEFLRDLLLADRLGTA